MTTPNPIYHVTATAWPNTTKPKLWELHINTIGITQATPHQNHRDIILDYINTLGFNTNNATITITYKP